MKRRTLLTFALGAAGLFLAHSPLVAASVQAGDGWAAARVESVDAVLACGPEGLSLTARRAGIPSATAAGEALWTLRFEAKGKPGEQRVLSGAGATPRIERLRDGFRLIYDVGRGGEADEPAATVALEFSGDGKTFSVAGSVSVRPGRWIARAFRGPVLGGIDARLDRQPLLVPYGMGMQVRSVPKVPQKAAKRAAAWNAAGDGVVELSTDYPSYAGSMPWCAFAGAEGGLYVGCHDPRQDAKTLVVRHSAPTQRFSLAWEHAIACAPGDTWRLPATVLYVYRGSWHEAARLYRAWYDTVHRAPRSVPWVREASGWLLAILKQQNEEIHWNYSSLPKLCDAADERGLDVLGLFGWAEGGHDRWYPVYEPDPKMGGEAALKASIAAAQKRGKRIILYYNGQLIDQGHTYWNPHGRDMTIQLADGSFGFQSWQKYHDVPARIHGLACFGSTAWRQCLLELALKAERLGADGIIYDQLAMTAPVACYATNHGHPVPWITYGTDRRDALQHIVEHMQRVRPDFAVMTEGLHDNVLGAVSIFHGCVMGVFSPTAAELKAMQGGEAVFAQYPDLFRYTYPEVISTVRNPRPMEDRTTANYCCLFGLRHEIETRYVPDKDYLLKGTMPTKKDYENIAGSRPNVDSMRTATREEAARYQHAVSTFQRKHAAFLMKGRFLGDSVFSLEGPSTVMAKAYASRGRLGVLVWNTGKAPVDFRLKVPGYTPTGVDAPESIATDAPKAVQAVEAAIEAPLKGNSVRLVLFEKR